MANLLFTKHPAAVGETYIEHMGVAFGFGTQMIVGGMACLLHGVFPFLFTRTGSKTIERLHARMVQNRVRACHAETASSASRVAPPAHAVAQSTVPVPEAGHPL
jgi:hypothetical protein